METSLYITYIDTPYIEQTINSKERQFLAHYDVVATNHFFVTPTTVTARFRNKNNFRIY